VRVQDIEEYGADNNTLRKILSIPTLNNSTIDNFMSRSKSMNEEQIKSIKKMRNEVNIKVAKSHLWWDRADVISKYGPHAFTFKLMAKRYQDSKKKSRAKTNDKFASLPEDDKKALVESNKQKACAREKKRRAAEMEGEDKENAKDEL